MEGASAMSENLNGISRKVASMLRRLGDGTDREFFITIHMLRQVLITAGTDIHAVADRIEEPPSQNSPPPRCRRSMTKVLRMVIPKAPSKVAAAR